MLTRQVFELACVAAQLVVEQLLALAQRLAHAGVGGHERGNLGGLTRGHAGRVIANARTSLALGVQRAQADQAESDRKQADQVALEVRDEQSGRGATNEQQGHQEATDTRKGQTRLHRHVGSYYSLTDTLPAYRLRITGAPACNETSTAWLWICYPCPRGADLY